MLNEDILNVSSPIGMLNNWYYSGFNEGHSKIFLLRQQYLYQFSLGLRAVLSVTYFVGFSRMVLKSQIL